MMPFSDYPGSSGRIDGKNRNDSRDSQKATRHWQEMMCVLTH